MSKARDLADSAQEINILDGKSFLDEDNLASDSATGIASQQSIKAYVDGITTTNITSTGSLNSGSITSGFGNIDNGSSTITTTGAISGGSFVIGSADINENDLESIDGITAGTVSASKAVVVNTNKDITGFRNITATGTISGSLSSTTTATTQAESDDSTKIATTAYVTDKITTLIGGAPSTLNDLNELAAAINDDANYNSTLTTALATKLPLAGGTMTGNLSFGDNDKAIFGTGSDLQIYSDGTHGIIKESGSGDLLIYGNNLRLGNADGSELYILGNNNAEVQLRYDNSTKLATTSTGISVTGNVAVSGTVDGVDIAAFKTSFDNLSTDIVSDTTPQLGGALDVNGHSISFGDNEKARFGNADDLQIYHNGSHTFVTNTTGNMYIQDDNYVEIGSSSGEVYIGASKDGAVNLRYDNSKKIETTSSGVNVTGNIAVSGTVDGRDVASDGSKLDGIATSANNYTHPTFNGDDIDILISPLSGASVISSLDFNVSTDTNGHVIDANGTVATRNLTLGDLGYTGATNANNYTHPTGNGNNHIPSGGSANQLLTYASAGTAQWTDPSSGATQVTVTSSNNMAYNDDKGAEEKYNAGQYLLEYTATSDCIVFAVSGTLNYRYWTGTGGYHGYSWRAYVNGVVITSANLFYANNPSSSTGSITNFLPSSAYLSTGQKIIVTAGEHETQNQGYLQFYNSSMNLAIIPI
jgi:hypothetical protein